MSKNTDEELITKELLEQVQSWFLKSILEIIGLSKINPSKMVEALNNYRNSNKENN